MPPDTTAAAAEPGRLQHFAAALFAAEGALVEPLDPDGIAVLAPASVQAALGVEELARFGFGPTLPEQAQRIAIEGAWLERFAALLGPRGRGGQRVLAADARGPSDPEAMLTRELILDNAVFRLQTATSALTRYRVFTFRYTAIADDKREGLLRLGVNLGTGALLDTALAAMDRAPDGAAPPRDAELPADWPAERLAARLDRAVAARLDLALAPFLDTIRRRVARDQERLHDYHNDLHRDALRKAAALPSGDPARERAEHRAAAIAREYAARIANLSRQYAVRVSLAWEQTETLLAPVTRLSVLIRRRKAERAVAMDWNPFQRRLEPPPAEDTLGPEPARLACDAALHLVSARGLDPCPGCGKAWCRACDPGRCPRCGAAP